MTTNKQTRILIHCSPSVKKINAKQLKELNDFLEKYKEKEIFINDACGVSEKIQTKFKKEKKPLTIFNALTNRVSNPNRFKTKKIHSRKSGLLAYIDRSILMTLITDAVVILTEDNNEITVLRVLRKAIDRDKTIKFYNLKKEKTCS